MYTYNHFDGWVTGDPSQQRPPETPEGCLRTILLAFILLALLSLFCGCRSTRYVPVEHVTHDTVQITRLQRDSIFLHDSIHVSEHQRGDTVFLEVNRWHTQYRDRTLHDTLYISRRDTIPQPYPVEVEVEKKLTWWQRLRLHLGDILLIALALAAVAWLIRKRAWWLSLIRKFH